MCMWASLSLKAQLKWQPYGTGSLFSYVEIVSAYILGVLVFQDEVEMLDVLGFDVPATPVTVNMIATGEPAGRYTAPDCEVNPLWMDTGVGFAFERTV